MYKMFRHTILKIMFIFLFASKLHAIPLLDIDYFHSVLSNMFIDDLKKFPYRDFRNFLKYNADPKIVEYIKEFNKDLEEINKNLNADEKVIKMAKLIVLFNWFKISLQIPENGNVKENINSFIDQLKSKKLELININGLHLGPNNANMLSEGLKIFKDDLKNLDISYNSLEDSGSKEIADALTVCKNINILNISNNDLESDGIKAISRALPNLDNLAYIYISNNIIDSESAVLLCNALEKLPNLESLDFSSCNINQDCMVTISKSFKSLKKLKGLNILNNNIGSKDSKKMLEIFKNCDKLVFLNISSCQLNSQDKKEIAKNLPNLIDLNFLDISNNKAESEIDDGIVEVIQALENNVKLTFLRISENLIGSIGVKALCNILGRLPKLEVLDVSFCNLDAADIISIVDAIIKVPNMKLMELNLSQINKVLNSPNNELFNKIKDLVDQNKIEVLFISKPQLFDEDLKSLKQIFLNKGKRLTDS